MFETFTKRRKFIVFRNLFIFIFKISVLILLILFFGLTAFVIQFSVKPRSVKAFNDYVVAKINQIPNVKVDFNSDDAFLQFNNDLELQYKIKDLKLNIYNNKIVIPNFSINFNFSKILIGQLIINDLTIQDINFHLDVDKIKEEKPTQEEEEKAKAKYTEIIKKICKTRISVEKFLIKNFKITLHYPDNSKIDLKIIASRFDMDLRRHIFSVHQDTLFNLNNSRINSRLKTLCMNEGNLRNCLIKFNKINLYNYRNIFANKTKMHHYLNNIYGYFDGNINLSINKKSEIENGNISLSSPLGSFYLKEFFDERLQYSILTLKSSFSNDFKIFNLDSIRTSFGDTKFFMSMFTEQKEEYKNVDLNFDIENINLKKLYRLWPNFLGQEENVRPWVIEHIVGGKSPRATASMNMKYFTDKSQKSGLQYLTADVQMNKVLLNYSDYFPKVSNIDGVAHFTKKDMLIDITSGNVLNSKINKGSVAIDFTQNKKSVKINANTKGHLYDLFIHINKNDSKLIRNSVDSIIEDYYTISNINLTVPITEKVNFYNTYINVNSSLLNKKNSLLLNSAMVPLSFIKKKKSNIGYGNIDLTKSNIEYLALNLDKPKNTPLKLDYKLEFKDDIVNILKFNPTNDYISFSTSGYLNLNKKIQNVNVSNVKYKNSNFNISYYSYAEGSKIFNNINITGKQIDYNNVIEKFKNSITAEKKHNENTKNESKINVNVNYFTFDNNRKLFGPKLNAIVKNNELKFLDFSAKLSNKKDLHVSLDKINKMFNLKSNDFGLLFDTVQLTDKIVNGSGEININSKTVDGKSIIFGNLKINKTFSIVPDANVKNYMLSHIGEEKQFKNLKKGLANNILTVDKIKGEFTYSDDIVMVKEVVANSKYMNLQILLSGFANVKTQEVRINGLFVPIGILNGLFGLNKLPIISNIIFGRKNAGLFASKFTIIKNGKNHKLEVKINKFSMLLPGILRDMFVF